MVARDVLELDPPAAELEPVRDPLLVTGDRQSAEVRREDEADGMGRAVLDHLADDLLDPRRPVPHPEVAPVLAAERGRERVDLPARHVEERRAPADGAVVLGDLLDDRLWRRPAGTNVREVARDLVQRLRAAVRHHEHAN